MAKKILRADLFGNLTLTFDGVRIGRDGHRAKRVWSLLAYLLYNPNRTVSPEELMSLLHIEETKSANPAGVLKTAIFRVRSTLDRLGEGMGKYLLLFRDGGYRWNPDVEIQTDCGMFDALVSSAADGAVGKLPLASLLEGLTLYTGHFCSRLSSEAWVTPISVYYHNLWGQMLRTAVPLLMEAGRVAEGAHFCRKAVELDLYNESYYQLMMRCLLTMGQREEAAVIYEDMSKRLLAVFGVVPDKTSRELYREALRSTNRNTISLDTITEHLREQGPIQGALICDFEFFRNVYQSQERMLARSGDVVHVALLTVSGRMNKDPGKRSLELAMDNLERHLAGALRKGDVIARCSGTQFVILLPLANFENSCAVCERIIGSFLRQYPHTPVKISYNVQGLVPAAERRGE